MNTAKPEQGTGAWGHGAIAPSEATAIKAYPPRGPLRQFRFQSPWGFQCQRCGQVNKSKLLVSVDGRWHWLLCNGCDGRLLPIWQIKAGDLPDEERDDAILEVLRQALPAESLVAARDELSSANKAYTQLSAKTQQMLATARAVTGVLREATGLDWSAAVIGLCKAAEVEMVRLVIDPVKAEVSAVDLTVDLRDKDLSRVAKYCAGAGPAPELGAITHFLTTAQNSVKRASTSPLIGAFRRISESWNTREWIFSPEGLSPLAQRLAKESRNPAAHTAILSEENFVECVSLVEGSQGILSGLLELSH